MNPSLSVIVAYMNEPTHLWFTLSSFREQILDAKIGAELIVGDNSPDKLNHCKKHFNDVKFIPVDCKSTSTVRNKAAITATGDIICFSDTHVVLSNGLIRKALEVFEKNKNLGILHTHTVFWGGGDGFYYYRLNLHESFCGTNCNKSATLSNPYIIPASGHGLYFIRRSVFEEIGGYLETQEGWGGEEIFLDLLTWMHGYEVMVDPQILHWHLPGEFTRPYVRNGVRYLLNHLYAAYVLGGEIVLSDCVDYYKLIEHEIVTRSVPEIIKINTKRRNMVVNNAKYTLKEVTGMFDDYGMNWRER